MTTKTFTTEAEAIAFMQGIEACGKSCYMVKTSFYNVVYNF